MVMSAKDIDDLSIFHDRVLQRLRKYKELSESSSSSSTSSDENELNVKEGVLVLKKKRKSQAWLEAFMLVTTKVTANFFSHLFSGPKRPSWPIHITIMSTFMQNLADYTHLADINLMRRFTDITFPILPSDIRITPVSLRVFNRGLTGILKEHDQKEDGSRVIDCEWIVTKSIWNKINHEHRMSGTNNNTLCIDENGVKWSNEKVILAVHGGGYIVMSMKTHRGLNYRLSKVTGRRVFAFNYRLAPEGPFPCGLHDVVHAFLYLTDPNGLAIRPENVLIVGDSAGGGLTLAAMLYLRDYGISLPEGAVLFSPWVDLTMSCPSWEHNKPYDILIKLKDEDPLDPVRMYLTPFEERSHLLTHPYVSPLFADLHDLPPLLVQFGGSEVLKDEIQLLVKKIKQTGTTFIQEEIYEDMIHIFQTFDFLKPAQKAMEYVGYWVKNVLSLHKSFRNNIQTGRTYTVPITPCTPDSLSQESADAEYLPSIESTPTFRTADCSIDDIDNGINIGTLISPPEPANKTSEECFFLKRAFSEPLSPVCDKATSTHEDGIAITLTAQPFNSYFHHRTQQRVRHFRSSSHPDLRELYAKNKGDQD